MSTLDTVTRLLALSLHKKNQVTHLSSTSGARMDGGSGRSWLTEEVKVIPEVATNKKILGCKQRIQSMKVNSPPN